MIERHLTRWAARRTRQDQLGDDALLEAVQALGLDESARAARYVADEMIGADRLARQLEVIDRRLDGQPGRLLHFPVPARATRTQPRARRWVAMAAACGLLFGLAAGRLIGPYPTHPEHPGAWSAGAADAGSPSPHEPTLADEHLLVEVDAALARTLHREFRVLDELTPRTSDLRRPGGR